MPGFFYPDFSLEENMPNQLAHYIFARRVWQALDPALRHRIDADSPAFHVGSFGPDPLFADPLSRCRSEGIFLHRQPGRVALERLRFSLRVKLPCAAEYAAGFFAHYALDRCCHPELKAMHARGEANHLAIEAAFDRELAYRHPDFACRHLMLNWNLCRAAVETYHTLSVRRFRSDVRRYRALCRLLSLPAGNRLCAVPGKFNPDWDGILPYPRPDAGIRRGMDYLDSQLQDLIPETADQMTRFFEAVLHDLPLDSWVDADFAGRVL